MLDAVGVVERWVEEKDSAEADEKGDKKGDTQAPPPSGPRAESVIAETREKGDTQESRQIGRPPLEPQRHRLLKRRQRRVPDTRIYRFRTLINAAPAKKRQAKILTKPGTEAVVPTSPR